VKESEFSARHPHFAGIIAAHALALDIPLVSIDAKLDQFGVRRIW
jgi:hypothetical protein